MITMSLDSDQTINPFDLEPGQTEPSNDHLSFLKNLTRFMIGDSGEGDTDLLDNLILNAIRKTYTRAQMRTEKPIPLYSDLYDELQNYYDEDRNPRVNEMARIAAAKMRAWVNNGMYARLFDAYTTIDMSTPWLYFNVEQLKDDPKLEVAMSLLIAYTTTRRAQGRRTSGASQCSMSAGHCSSPRVSRLLWCSCSGQPGNATPACGASRRRLRTSPGRRTSQTNSEGPFSQRPRSR